MQPSVATSRKTVSGKATSNKTRWRASVKFALQLLATFLVGSVLSAFCRAAFFRSGALTDSIDQIVALLQEDHLVKKESPALKAAPENLVQEMRFNAATLDSLPIALWPLSRRADSVFARPGREARVPDELLQPHKEFYDTGLFSIRATSPSLPAYRDARRSTSANTSQ